jgi:outer membrane protein assembly factor BamB
MIGGLQSVGMGAGPAVVEPGKRLLGALMGVVLIASLVGCDSTAGMFPSDPSGGAIAVRISSDTASRTIVPTFDTQIWACTITASGVGPTAAVTVDGSKQYAVIDGLAEGTWSLEATARNVSGFVVASGTSSVSVVTGQTVSATVQLAPVAGDGTLDLSVTWPSEWTKDVSVDASLTPVGGSSQPLSFALSPAADPETATYSGNWPTGYYTLRVGILDGTSRIWGRTESVRIVNGQVSIGQFVLTGDGANLVYGGLGVDVISDIARPIPITLTGHKAEIGLGESLTITAETTETPDSYQWYLDGTPLSGETGPSLSIGGALSRGSYRVDVVVGSGSVTSSAGFNLVVRPDPGSIKWQYSGAGDYIVGSPAVAQDLTVYFGALDQYLYAIDSNGSLKWKVSASVSLHSSPVLGADGSIYCGEGSNMTAFAPDGSVRWRFATGGGVVTAPAIDASSILYFGSGDGTLHAVKADGTEHYSVALGVPLGPTAVASDGTVYVSSSNGNLYAVNPDGSLKWQFTTGGKIEATPAIGADGTVYIGSWDGNFYAVDPSGTEKWRVPTGDLILYSAAIDAAERVYFTCDDGYLYCVNPDGTVAWAYDTGYAARSAPAIGRDGTVYLGTSSGIQAVTSDGASKWTVLADACERDSPAIADGILYIGTVMANTLFAVHIEPAGPALSSWPMLSQNASNKGLQP